MAVLNCYDMAWDVFPDNLIFNKICSFCYYPYLDAGSTHWFPCSCVGVEEDKAAEIDLYHCPNCQITHGPSISKLLKCVSFWYYIIHCFWKPLPLSVTPSTTVDRCDFLRFHLQCVSVVGEISRQMGVLWQEEILLGLLKQAPHSSWGNYGAALFQGKPSTLPCRAIAACYHKINTKKTKKIRLTLW